MPILQGEGEKDTTSCLKKNRIKNGGEGKKAFLVLFFSYPIICKIMPIPTLKHCSLQKQNSGPATPRCCHHVKVHGEQAELPQIMGWTLPREISHGHKS